MPHNLDLIFTLTGGLTAALVLGFITQRLRLYPITLNPVLFRLVDPLSAWLTARFARSAGPSTELPIANGETTIVVGYGPVGRTLAELLKEHELEPTVIELNHDTVNQLRENGVRALYGDAAQRDVLEQAGIRNASALIFAASGCANAVVSAEAEVAFGMAERLLNEIGATPEQIDRARDRVRSELLSS